MFEEELEPMSGFEPLTVRLQAHSARLCLSPAVVALCAVELRQPSNRVHLDIHVEPSRKADEAARLTRLGAELIATHDDRGPLTYVMRDPEGNEFCLH
jgi:hypothetical protein